MANNISALKTAIISAFTANLDIATRTALIARFIVKFQSEWNYKVANGTVDNAANRGAFAVDKIFDYINSVYRDESHKELVAAVVAETIT